MIKKTILLILLSFGSLLFADTIYFKDGTTLDGEILKTTETEVIILTSLGTMTIGKDTVNRVVKDKPKIIKAETNINLITKDLYKYDPDYQMSRKMFGLAMAFFIPANVLTFGAIAIGTPFIIDYYSKPVYADYYLYFDSERKAMPHDYYYAGLYGSIMVTGLILGCVSIPFFLFSSRYTELYKKRHEISMITGFQSENFVLGLKISM